MIQVQGGRKVTRIIRTDKRILMRDAVFLVSSESFLLQLSNHRTIVRAASNRCAGFHLVVEGWIQLLSPEFADSGDFYFGLNTQFRGAIK
jgi:hypothetical protein